MADSYAESIPQIDVQVEADRMLALLDLLSTVPVADIVKVVEAAHTVGWFLDPTAYRDALSRGAMDDVARLARALEEPMRIHAEIRERRP